MSDSDTTTDGAAVPEYDPQVTRTVNHMGRDHTYLANRLTNEELAAMEDSIQAGGRGGDLEDYLVAIDGRPKGSPEWGKVPVDLVNACETDLRAFFGRTAQRRLLSAVRRTSSASPAEPETDS